MTPLETIVEFARNQSQRMDRLADDPQYSGDQQTPTGDDWNDLINVIERATGEKIA